MKILQLCKKFPFPLKDGESIAVTYLSRALNDLGHEVTLLSMNTTKHYTDVSNLPASFDQYQAIHCTELDNSLKATDAIANLFSKESYHVSRFVSKTFADKLRTLLQSDHYDIVQLETLYLAPYIDIIRKYSTAKVVMRSHNVEFEIWERITANASFWPRKWYLRHLTKKLRKYEIDQLHNYDHLVTVSERDLTKFCELGYEGSSLVSPIGLDIDQYTPAAHQGDAKLRVGFIGSLDWMPNTEGLQWFLDDVWPRLMARGEQVELHIAGRHTPQSILDLDLPNVYVHGEVPDAIDFMNSTDIMIAPLFSGSGMRVKIIEGMALKKPIITTAIGLEGIAAIDGKDVMIAESANDFCDAICKAAADRDMISRMGMNARLLMEEKYDHKAIANNLVNSYLSLLGIQDQTLTRKNQAIAS